MSDNPKSADKDADAVDVATDGVCIQTVVDKADTGQEHLCPGPQVPTNKITQAGKARKRMSAVEKRDYVLTHLGIDSVAVMAEEMGCTEDWVYRIMQKIRAERELLHGRLIENVAEEQFNRLNKMAQDAFQALTEYRREHPEGGDGLYKLHKIYRDSEHGLTYFLKAVGLYRDDKPVIATQINVNIGKKGIGEILQEIRGEYEASIVDAIAVNVKQPGVLDEKT